MITLPHLDVNVTTVCNFRCVSCSHASPFSDPYWMEVETMVRDLKSLREVVHFEQVCLVGGEPTLHADLGVMMDEALLSGIADKLCVVTNGSRLKTLTDSFYGRMQGQVLRLSIYGRLDADVLPFAQAKAEEFGFDLQAWPYDRFYKQLKSVPDDGAESFKSCEWRSDCYTVHEGHFYLCPQSAFFPKRFMNSDVNDGLSLEGITEEKLNAYLNRTEPFEACKICCAGSKISAPWREANKSEWKLASTL